MSHATIPFSLDTVKQIFSETTYKRGLDYFNQRRVVDLEQWGPDQWGAQVAGSYDYEVKVDLSDDDIQASCECPAFDSYGECKHIVAVLLTMILEGTKKAKNFEHEGNQEFRQYERTNEMIEMFLNRTHSKGHRELTEKKQPLHVEYICKMDQLGPRTERFLSLELKIGPKRPYVVKEISDFLQAVKEQTPYPFTRNFSYDPEEYEFLEEDLEILQTLQLLEKQNEMYHKQMNPYAYRIPSNRRSLLVPPMIADSLIMKIQNRNWSFNGQSAFTYIPYSTDRKLPLTFRLGKKEADDFELDFSLISYMRVEETYEWLILEKNIYKLSLQELELALQLSSSFLYAKNGVVPIAPAQMGAFVSHVIPSLKQLGHMHVTDQVSDQIIQPDLNLKIWLDREEERITMKVEYHYGSWVLNPFSPDLAVDLEGVILMRDVEKEQALMQLIEQLPVQLDGNSVYLEGEEDLFEFLYTALPKLQEAADVYLTDAVKLMIYPREQRAVTRVDVDPSGDLLEISFDMEGVDRGEVRQLLRSIVEKKKFHRLSNGAFVSLQEDAYQTIDHMISDLQLSKKQLEKDVLKLPLYRGLQVEHILGEKDQSSAKLEKRFRRLLQDLKNPDTIDYQIPDNLQASLRDYQQFGFGWLKTMAHYRMGGILADDMGLGKTLQAITYLLSEHETGLKTSLVVAPASLIYNWKREFDKFAPDLQVVVAYGSPEERQTLLREQKPDVFITSYPLLRQDLDLYDQMTFDSLILDEAQAIKNHLTKTAQAVKEVKAVKRFALSGTPIENSLDELWSIFDAILPGFFQNQKQFRQLEREKLAQLVSPFILRRLKTDVLKELPEKIETVHYSELSKEQKQLYLGYLEKIQKETKESLQSDGFDKSRMKILAGLTRLRQLCCHPSLFLENYQGESGKLEQLLEIIENALENKRRILIFSQFTSMLQLIDQELKQSNISSFYLDGQTPSKDRVEMAERFNEGENSLFLISLKAGGTGLNLTGADTVILYDLWWNPAVEEQAAGRAHRMGQKNSVQVMRLVATGTIEEKIYELQQKKKELIEQVLQPGESGASSLTEKEVLEILGIE